MALTNWMGAFGRAQAQDVSHDLERGYESALLIQSIELEHYNDRPVRPELDLRIPRAAQAGRNRPGSPCGLGSWSMFPTWNDGSGSRHWGAFPQHGAEQ